jgi:hypothetical protein
MLLSSSLSNWLEVPSKHLHHFNTVVCLKEHGLNVLSMLSNGQDTVPIIADIDINCYLEQQSSLQTPQACKGLFH